MKFTIEQLSDVVYPIVTDTFIELRPAAVQVCNLLYKQFEKYASIGILMNLISDFRNNKIGYTSLIEQINKEVSSDPIINTKMDSDPIPTSLDAPLDGGKIQVQSNLKGTMWKVGGVDILIPNRIGDKKQIVATDEADYEDWIYGDGRGLSISKNQEFYNFCLTQKGAGYIMSTFEERGEKYFNIPNTKIFYRVRL
jgi:hypothetical protein